MSIPYRLTEVKDNISDEPKHGYYAKVVTRGTIDTLTLCKDISRTCTLTVADLRAAIEAISESLTTYLKDGYNVYIDGLGTFSISAESKRVEDEAELRGQSVRVKNINFRSSVRLKNEMAESTFERAGEQRPVKHPRKKE